MQKIWSDEGFKMGLHFCQQLPLSWQAMLFLSRQLSSCSPGQRKIKLSWLLSETLLLSNHLLSSYSYLAPFVRCRKLMLSNKTSGYVAFKAPHGGGTATLLLNCSHGAHGLDLISVHFLMFSFQCSAKGSLDIQICFPPPNHWFNHWQSQVPEFSTKSMALWVSNRSLKLGPKAVAGLETWSMVYMWGSNIVVTLTIINCTYNAYTIMHILCTYFAYTMHILCIYFAYTMHILCIYHAYTMHIPCIYYTYTVFCSYYANTLHILCIYFAYTLHRLCIYYAYTLHILCIYYAYTMHILCIHYTYIVHILCIYYTYTMHILCIYYAYTMHIIWIYHAYTMHILCIYYAYILHILCIYFAYTMHILCIYYAYTMHIFCIYYAYTMHTLCIYFA